MSYFSKATYTGDGSTATFSVPFPYLDKSHVFATINGVDATITAWPSAGLATITPTPPVGSAVFIVRKTPKTVPAVVWSNPSTIRSSDLNKNTNQLLYIAQETQDNNFSSSDVSLDFGGRRGINVGDPTSVADAANKRYVDTNFLGLNGGANYDYAGRRGINAADPVGTQDVVNKRTADYNYLKLSGVTYDFENKRGIRVADPVGPQDVMSKAAADAGYLNLSGTTYDFKSKRGVNVADPVGAQDAATKNYVVTTFLTIAAAVAGYLGLNAGNWDFQSKRGINVSSPIASGDVATKGYVDAIVPGGGSSATAQYESRGAAIASSTAGAFNYLRTAGYYAPGDGGGAVYQKVATQPTHAGKFQSADGVWWELKERVVNIRMLGAKDDGSTDATTAIQNALDMPVSAVEIPPTVTGFRFTSLTMPTTLWFTFFGHGVSSKLIQTGTGIKWPVVTNTGYYLQTIRDLFLQGTSGTGNTLDMSYTGGMTVRDIMFWDVPMSYSSLKVDGASDYTHDTKLIDVQIYHNGTVDGPVAGIELGPKAGDGVIDGFMFSGAFHVSTAILARDGAQSWQISNSHPYGAKYALFSGTASAATYGFVFTNVRFDFANQNLVFMQNYIAPMFVNCAFEAQVIGTIGVYLQNVKGALFSNSYFNGVYGSSWAIKEFGTSDYNVVNGASVPYSGNWPTGIVSLTGANSVVTNLKAY